TEISAPEERTADCQQISMVVHILAAESMYATIVRIADDLRHAARLNVCGYKVQHSLKARWILRSKVDADPPSEQIGVEKELGYQAVVRDRAFVTHAIRIRLTYNLVRQFL